ncbi:MAG: hypothetical protein QXV04_04990 [Desulfurococcaceae archaeon]
MLKYAEYGVPFAVSVSVKLTGIFVASLINKLAANDTLRVTPKALVALEPMKAIILLAPDQEVLMSYPIPVPLARVDSEVHVSGRRSFL